MSSSDIEEYIVIQHDMKNIEISIKTKSILSIEHKVNESLFDLFKMHNCLIPTITYTPYDVQHSVKKLKRVERRFQILESEILT
jgi:hypothetical protein